MSEDIYKKLEKYGFKLDEGEMRGSAAYYAEHYSEDKIKELIDNLKDRIKKATSYYQKKGKQELSKELSDSVKDMIERYKHKMSEYSKALSMKGKK